MSLSLFNITFIIINLFLLQWIKKNTLVYFLDQQIEIWRNSLRKRNTKF